MNSQNDRLLTRLSVAEATIDLAIAHLTNLRYPDADTPAPDVATSAALAERIHALEAERDALDTSDLDAIEAVIDKYRAEAQAALAGK